MIENEIIIKKVINGHTYLQFRKLNELGINHVITTKDLNFSFKHQSDEDLRKNIHTVCSDNNFNEENFSRPEQKHTNNVEVLEETGLNIYKETDALITDKNNIPLGITTADCIPIIIYDPNKKVIANIHSGWKGTLNKIVLNTVNKMLETYGCNIKDMLFFFGPSICEKCFEVEDDVKELFENAFGNKYITKGNIINNKQKYYIDLNKINLDMLLNINVPQKNVYISNICTRCNSDKLHSYRASNTPNTKLEITIITL